MHYNKNSFENDICMTNKNLEKMLEFFKNRFRLLVFLNSIFITCTDILTTCINCKNKISKHIGKCSQTDTISYVYKTTLIVG